MADDVRAFPALPGSLPKIGTGLPTAGNTHEIAQAVAPECRVVYVDNDPVVLVHARALLTSDPAGATSICRHTGIRPAAY